ncbi:hypothetical protein AAG570_001700 [Ranatra chinensis]|uniref:Uncharacterized protein n=1 Tax=Ranatra chinensis TaxID=642074 RepID=A0ABD0Y9A2_9HEMI
MASKRRNMFHKNKTQETTEKVMPSVNASLPSKMARWNREEGFDTLPRWVNATRVTRGRHCVSPMGKRICREVDDPQAPRSTRRTATWRVPRMESPRTDMSFKTMFAEPITFSCLTPAATHIINSLVFLSGPRFVFHVGSIFEVSKTIVDLPRILNPNASFQPNEGHFLKSVGDSRLFDRTNRRDDVLVHFQSRTIKSPAAPQIWPPGDRSATAERPGESPVPHVSTLLHDRTGFDNSPPSARPKLVLHLPQMTPRCEVEHPDEFQQIVSSAKGPHSSTPPLLFNITIPEEASRVYSIHPKQYVEGMLCNVYEEDEQFVDIKRVSSVVHNRKSDSVVYIIMLESSDHMEDH